MNTRIAAPVLGTVSLVALLVGGAGAAQARVMIDDGPRTVASQGVSFDRVEAIRSAKQAESGTTDSEQLRQHQQKHGASSERLR